MVRQKKQANFQEGPVGKAEEELMSPREVAGRLGRRLDSVYMLLWAGRLPGARKVDGRWLIAMEAVEERLRKRKGRPRSPQPKHSPERSRWRAL